MLTANETSSVLASDRVTVNVAAPPATFSPTDSSATENVGFAPVSLAAMVTTPVPSPMVAGSVPVLGETEVRTTLNVSARSYVGSSTTGTSTCCEVTDGPNVSRAGRGRCSRRAAPAVSFCVA